MSKSKATPDTTNFTNRCPYCQEDITDKAKDYFDGALFEAGDYFVMQCPCCNAGIDVCEQEDGNFFCNLEYNPPANEKIVRV